MGIRQTLNENPKLGVGVGIGVLVLALALIIYELMPSRTGPTNLGQQFWYTDDDGKTWFADDSNKLPPYKDSKGKEAVRAFVYRCNSGTAFCAYLQRYTPEGKQKIEQLKKTGGSIRSLSGGMSLLTEVKKPGGKWVHYGTGDSHEYFDVTRVQCPDGSTNGLEVVLPGGE